MPKSPTPDPLRGLSTSPRLSSPTGMPERLLSKRTMEIQAEEGILPYRSPTHASSNSLLGSFGGSLLDEGSRSKTPESKLGLSLFDSSPDSSGLDSTVFPTTRRARADTMPSSLSKYPFRSKSPESDISSPIGRNFSASPGAITPTRINNGNTTRSRGSSLSVPSSTFSDAFGSSIFSPWQSAVDTEAGKNHFDDPNEDGVNPLVKTLDYLGLDDSSHSPSQLDESFGGSRFGSPPEVKSIANLRASLGRLRSHSMSSTAKYDDVVTPLPAPLQQLRKAPSRGRAISVGFLDAPQKFFVPGESNSNSDISLGSSYTNENLMFSENGSMSNSLGLNGSDSFLGHGQSFESATDFEHEYFDPLEMSATDHLTPTRSLWIGNIDSSLTSADLMSIFSPYGPIESLRLLPEKECAFVNYVKIEDAIRAREEMQGGRVGNCIIRVGYGKADIYNCDSQTMQPTRALWIGNISASITPTALQAVFAPFGAIESARILTHKNCGFVNFEKVEDAIKARKEMNNKEIYGSAVRIGYAKVPPKDSTTKSGTTPFGLPFSSTLPQPSVPITPWHTNASALSGTPGNSSAELEPSLSSSLGNSTTGAYETVDLLGPLMMDDNLIAFPYASVLPPIPEPNVNRKIDQSRLREIRKRLDSHTSSAKDLEAAFHELFDDSVDLCSDYIGNTVIQKLMERGGDSHKLLLIERVAPHMASIGVHKNGTWAIQKMIDCANTPAQMQPIVMSLKPFTPPLLLDQFGNYVIQCCLRLGPQRNQFIYDAIHARCWEIAQGRFGARAIRACLESQYTTKRQQRLVAVALIHNALLLATNPNGSLLLTWLLDSSNLAGRYRALAPQFISHLSHLCTHKLASLTVFKIINQKVEADARELLLQSLFLQDQVLEDVLSDQVHGVGLIQKILASNLIEESQKNKFSERVRLMLGKLQVHQVQGYRRLMEELGVGFGLKQYSDISGSGYAFSNANDINGGLQGAGQHALFNALLANPQLGANYPQGAFNNMYVNAGMYNSLLNPYGMVGLPGLINGTTPQNQMQNPQLQQQLHQLQMQLQQLQYQNQENPISMNPHPRFGEDNKNQESRAGGQPMSALLQDSEKSATTDFSVDKFSSDNVVSSDHHSPFRQHF
ncbi:hypothetical protein K493DRAFT_336624 [Basidiobolus meristosporus CBS 931.73]|uniref:ARM repeat-containing protein n=1 Tax=Basidiobolus meristosporus CBS 931.73 TaxID=1314790 RepID=A0A1Y1YGY6_9FUNG|nr:hypothetical protein K493DRAFT_336624 [Basidiobolus meristosporus CBS 931.73]|eukprot:ORX97272.1 hypothetical protein K493DRAFT_336624 [Basidiobolus meristosporus CBS 931.73]